MSDTESLPDRLRAHAHFHPESAEVCREAADAIDNLVAAYVELDDRLGRYEL